MSNLLTSAIDNLASQERVLKRAMEECAFVNILPTELQQLEGTVSYAFDTIASLRMTGGEETLRVLKRLGVQGFVSKLHMWSGEWYADYGKIKIDDRTISFYVSDTKQPPKCHIEPYQEEVTKYKQVCEEEEPEVVSA